MSKILILKSNGKLLRSKYKDVIIRQVIHLAERKSYSENVSKHATRVQYKKGIY